MLSTTLVESVTPHAAPSSMPTEALQIFLVSYGARFVFFWPQRFDLRS